MAVSVFDLQLSIAGVMRVNERRWRSDVEIDAGLLRIWQVMQACVQRGCAASGTLPGGFNASNSGAEVGCRGEVQGNRAAGSR